MLAPQARLVRYIAQQRAAHHSVENISADERIKFVEEQHDPRAIRHLRKARDLTEDAFEIFDLIRRKARRKISAQHFEEIKAVLARDRLRQLTFAVAVEAPAAPTVTRSQDYDGKITFSSSDESVVKVHPDTGELTIVGEGTAIISVSGE